MKNACFIPLVFIFACQLPVATSTATAIDCTVNRQGTDQLSKRSATEADTVTLNGEWFLQPVLSSDTATGKIPSITFNLSSKKFSGNTGCNRMSGTFELKGYSLVFNENIITTKMVCNGYNEEAFLKSLLRVNGYKFENGVLVLLADATALSRWTRKPDKTVKMGKT